MAERDEELTRDFLKETQFHLGSLITEQSHPKTRTLSQTIKDDVTAGVDMLLSVDEDIITRAEDVFASPAYNDLKKALKELLLKKKIIFFSGCGSTGRLAIMLETLWRRFWNYQAGIHENYNAVYKARAERSCSIMTGGDRALIRSVENFEDYPELGRRQSRDNGVGPGDLFIAVSEGGETSSVIGTALEAADLGARVFFLYNNPDDVLMEKVERSRIIITDPRIKCINLTTGPMALSGSTRMQATTMELFVLSTALEDVCAVLVQEETGTVASFKKHREREYLILYRRLLAELRQPENLKALSNLILLEESTYEKQGLITYISDTYLLDIFSDTTERSPTFMLPPFRKRDDRTGKQSWAFAKDPLHGTEQAWCRLLQRVPRGLDWTASDYKKMNSSESLIKNPPKLDLEEIFSYPIGQEDNREREKKGRLFWFDLTDGRSEKLRDNFQTFYLESKESYALGASLVRIGKGVNDGDININLDLPITEMYAFWHIMFKLILNTVSTGTMGRMGRIRGNWMIQVDATNKKLIDRSCRIISALTEVSYEEACRVLFKLMAKNEKESRLDNRSFVVLAIEQIENGD